MVHTIHNSSLTPCYILRFRVDFLISKFLSFLKYYSHISVWIIYIKLEYNNKYAYYYDVLHENLLFS